MPERPFRVHEPKLTRDQELQLEYRELGGFFRVWYGPMWCRKLEQLFDLYVNHILRIERGEELPNSELLERLHEHRTALEAVPAREPG